MDRVALRRGLSPATRPRGAPAALRPFPRPAPRAIRRASSLPSVTQISFWKSLVPKPLRASERKARAQDKKPRSGEWNPATFFIVIFLFIGSMSIQQIALKREGEAFTRRTDVRIARLRDVVRRLQRGEEVHVEQALGSGDPVVEQEWDEVLKEIERGDMARKKQTRSQNEQATAATSTAQSSQPAATPERASTASPPAAQTGPSGRSTFF